MGYRRVKLMLTESCNLNCAHCYMGEKGSRHMDTAVALRLLSEAHEIGAEVADLTGGEARLHPDFILILHRALQLGFSRINICTNGFGLDALIFTGLQASKVHCFISMDGVSDETVRRIRGRGIEELFSLFRVLKMIGIEFSLRFSLNVHNHLEAAEMMSFANRLGVGADLEPTQMIGNADESLVLSNAQALRTTEVISGALSIHHFPIEESFTSSFPCDGGQQDLLSIDVEGRGTTCLMMEGNSAVIKEGMGLLEMWNALRPYKERMERFAPNMEACPKCPQYSICRSGCLATAYTKGCFNPWKEG